MMMMMIKADAMGDSSQCVSKQMTSVRRNLQTSDFIKQDSCEETHQCVGDAVSVDKSCIVVDNSKGRDSTVNEHRQNVDQLRAQTHLHPYIINAVITKTR